jgi:hypothetical protein
LARIAACVKLHFPILPSHSQKGAGMLLFVKIRDFALIRELEIEFDRGLNHYCGCAGPFAGVEIIPGDDPFEL